MAKKKPEINQIEKLFHSPKRLAIMTTLCGNAEGIAFNDLKEECRLTGGNLNSHLKVLKEEKIIRIEKSFLASKPRTTISVTDKGYSRFYEYLENLSTLLKDIKKSMKD